MTSSCYILDCSTNLEASFTFFAVGLFEDENSHLNCGILYLVFVKARCETAGNSLGSAYKAWSPYQNIKLSLILDIGLFREADENCISVLQSLTGCYTAPLIGKNDFEWIEINRQVEVKWKRNPTWQSRASPIWGRGKKYFAALKCFPTFST